MILVRSAVLVGFESHGIRNGRLSRLEIATNLHDSPIRSFSLGRKLLNLRLALVVRGLKKVLRFLFNYGNNALVLRQQECLKLETPIDSIFILRVIAMLEV